MADGSSGAAVTRGLALFIGVALLVTACSDRATPAADTLTTEAPRSVESVVASSATTTTTEVTSDPPVGRPSSTVSASPVSTVGRETASVGEAVDCVAGLSLRRQIALLVWPAVYPNDWDAAIRIVDEFDVGGAILMSTAGWSQDELRQHLVDLEQATDLGVLVATDEEGGDVQRLSVLGDLPSQRAMSHTVTPAEAGNLIAAHAAMLAAVGVDVVFGPVVDVAPVEGDVPLQDSRLFSGPPDDVAAYASSYVDGWRSAGLLPVLKHYPGHGSASGDTHDEAGNTGELAQLEAWDLIPYAELASSGAAVMVGHLTVPGLTEGLPATRSPAAVDYLRNDLGFGDALLISDALDMGAVGLSEPEAAVMALAAGIDVVIFTGTSGTGAVIEAIESAVQRGALDPSRVVESARRVVTQLSVGSSGCQQIVP